MVADQQLREANLKTWLELEALKLGTDNQRERWNASMLPDEEITALARAELFRPFDGFARWGKIRPRQISHVKGCTVIGQPWDSTTSLAYDTVTDGVVLTSEQWDTLKRLVDAIMRAQEHDWAMRAKLGFLYGARIHRATCTVCESELRKASVLVSVEWAGRPLSREYAL